MTVLGYILNIVLRLIEYSPDQQYTPFVDNATDLFSFHIAPSVVKVTEQGEEVTNKFQFDAFSEIILSVGTALVCVICYFLAACQARKSGSLAAQYKVCEFKKASSHITSLVHITQTTSRNKKSCC